MKKNDYNIAKELKDKLSQVTNLIDFRIFGSRAKNHYDEYSDMDVFLEIPFINNDLADKMSNIIWEVGFENYLVISPLIFTKDEIENSPLRSSPIVENIFREGIKV